MKILYIILISYLAYSSPTITLQPESDNVCYGTEDYELTVKAISNSHTLNYQWMRDGKDLIVGIDSPFETDKASLKFFPADYGMSGVYTCDIWYPRETRKQAIATDTAVINVVQKPEIINAPEFVYSKMGEPFEIKIDVSGEDLEFEWYLVEFKKGKLDSTKIEDNDIYSGANSNLLSFSLRFRHKDYAIVCKISNECGYDYSDYIYPIRIYDRLFSGVWGWDAAQIIVGRLKRINAQIYSFLERPYEYFNFKEMKYIFCPTIKFKVLVNGTEREIYKNDNEILNKYWVANNNSVYTSYEIECDGNYIVEVYGEIPGILKDYTSFTFSELRPPAFTRAPINKTITEKDEYNENFKFKINSYDNSPIYEFELTDIYGDGVDFDYEINYTLPFGSGTLTIPNIQQSDSGIYQIMGTNNGQCDWGFYSQLFEMQVLPKEEQPLSIEYSKYKLISSPNPFIMDNNLEFNLEKSSPIKIELFDARGMLITTLEDKYLGAGEHNYSINSDNLNLYAGVYFYRIQIGNKSFTKEIIKL